VKQIAFSVVALLLATQAEAYMGPGAGLGMIGSLLAVGGALLLAFAGVVVLPLRLLLKRRRSDAPRR